MTNTETLRAGAMHWHVGWNMPGYLPECNVASFDNIEDARTYLIDELGFHAANQETWADEHDCDDIPCPIYGDRCPWNMAREIEALADELEADQDDVRRLGAWNGYAGDLVYWIELCVEDCDLESEDY